MRAGERVPHALVQITLNNGRVRVTTRPDADAEYVATCAANLDGGGGWSFVPKALVSVSLRLDVGFGRVDLGTQRGGA